ncbi:MAG: GMC family oxidoreductase, partial [Pseudomonadota bacterium]
MQKFDYIIVGAGTAGCLLANRLSKDPSRRVLLIEAGGSDNYHWIHIPVGYLYCIGNPRTDWMYRTQPEPGLNGRDLIYPRGKTLGGCSSINGMIYMRGQSRDYDAWAEEICDDEWRWENCLPDFIRHEDHYRLDSQKKAVSPVSDGFSNTHGHGGEWRVEKQRLSWEILDSFADAMVEYGVPRIDDFNSGDNFGVSYFEVNQRNGWRWNASKAFLRTSRHRRNLVVWTDAKVQGLCFVTQGDGKPRCSGVRIRRKGELQTVVAAREVVLSAGSIGSTQILQLSGIGPGQHLRELDIDVVRDAPGVGHNLQDHLQIRTVFKVKNALTMNTLAATTLGKAKIALEYLLRRSGPMSMAPSQLGAFSRSDASQTHPNLEYHVQPLSLEAFGEDLHDFPAFTASVCNLNPTSRGSVMINSSDIDQPPVIAPNYLSTDEDRRVAALSIRQVRSVVAKQPLVRYKPEELKPGIEFDNDEALSKVAGDIGTTIFHPVGTAKMGTEDDPYAVLDSKLRVFGV